MVEFESQNNSTMEYEFQVDKTSDPKKQLYNVIIGNDLLYNMGVNIVFKEKQIQWNDDKIPLKEMGFVHDKEFCLRCFIACIQTVLFSMMQIEERQDKMMNCIYSKVDIDAMVADLDINNSNKQHLRKTLRKFENGLFWWKVG